MLARLLARPMGASLKTQVIIENVTGAGSTIGANRVAKAPPNGYTLLLHNLGHSTAISLYRKLAYHPINDFEPIGLIADIPMTLVTKKDLPSNDLKELLAYAVFFQRPISATLLTLALLALIVASLPVLYKKREEAFRDE